MTKGKYKDPRPICDCDAYTFPHKIDSRKCKGRVFFSFYLYHNRELCNQCNCFNEDSMTCDAMDGRESIKEAECYIEALHHFPGEHLRINYVET